MGNAGTFRLFHIFCVCLCGFFFPFLKINYFRIVLDLQKCCKDSTEGLYMLDTQPPTGSLTQCFTLPKGCHASGSLFTPYLHPGMLILDVLGRSTESFSFLNLFPYSPSLFPSLSLFLLHFFLFTKNSFSYDVLI